MNLSANSWFYIVLPGIFQIHISVMMHLIMDQLQNSKSKYVKVGVVGVFDLGDALIGPLDYPRGGGDEGRPYGEGRDEATTNKGSSVQPSFGSHNKGLSLIPLDFKFTAKQQRKQSLKAP
jgi:hypothetical protein